MAEHARRRSDDLTHAICLDVRQRRTAQRTDRHRICFSGRSSEVSTTTEWVSAESAAGVCSGKLGQYVIEKAGAKLNRRRHGSIPSRAGSLILISPTPFEIDKLRPSGSKLLAEDVNFRVARNRFNSESIFAFLDVAEIEKEEQEQQKKFEEQRKEAIASMEESREALEKAQAELEKLEAEMTPTPPDPEDSQFTTFDKSSGSSSRFRSYQHTIANRPTFGFALMLLSAFASPYAGEEAKWPEALGLGLSLEGDSFDVRALLVTAPGKTSDPLPFVPMLKPGPALLSEAPSILPADTEIFVNLSLDLPNLYAALSKPRPVVAMAGVQLTSAAPQLESPFDQIEKKLNLKIKDDLLPLLGSEVVLSMPLTGLDPLQMTPSASPSPSPSPNATAPDQAKPSRSLAVLVSLKDKEGMRTLLPKIIEAAAFKGANSLAQTERREDTELVSYANLLAYAFIGNYLVISPDAATTRHVVDSYLNHQTLSSDPHFKNVTRWQPRMVQAQVYLSSALMESYRTSVQQPSTPLDDQMRAILTRLTIVPQPVTYSLSNEGFGPLHELHLPKNLVLMLIATIAGASKAAATAVQETPGSNPN